MKQNDIDDINVRQLQAQNLENLFNVFTDEDNNYYYNIMKSVHFPDDLNPHIYIDYVTKQKDTWPLISWKHYRNVKLWWIICAINRIDNPVAIIKPGNVIKILRSEYVKSVLAELRGV